MAQVAKPPRIVLTTQKPWAEVQLKDKTLYQVQVGQEGYQVSREGERYVLTDAEGRTALSREGLGGLKIQVLDADQHKVRLEGVDLQAGLPQPKARDITLDLKHPSGHVYIGDEGSSIVRCRGEVYKISSGEGTCKISCAVEEAAPFVFSDLLVEGEDAIIGDLIFSSLKGSSCLSVRIISEEITLDEQTSLRRVYLDRGESCRVRCGVNVYLLLRKGNACKSYRQGNTFVHRGRLGCGQAARIDNLVITIGSETAGAVSLEWKGKE